MKKLMIVAAIVCAAAVTQAASVDWSASLIKSDKTGASAADGYLTLTFLSSVDAGSTAATLGKVWSIDAAVAALTKDGGADLSKFKIDGGMAVSSAATSKGMLNVKDAWTDANWKDTSDPVKSFAIVFNAATVDGATEYLVLPETAAAAFADAADLQTVKFGSQKNNLAWGTISTAAVPEPTSGLLLLLGVAGLALRRRRA